MQEWSKLPEVMGTPSELFSCAAHFHFQIYALFSPSEGTLWVAGRKALAFTGNTNPFEQKIHLLQWKSPAKANDSMLCHSLGAPWGCSGKKWSSSWV